MDTAIEMNQITYRELRRISAPFVVRLYKQGIKSCRRIADELKEKLPVSCDTVETILRENIPSYQSQERGGKRWGFSDEDYRRFYEECGGDSKIASERYRDARDCRLKPETYNTNWGRLGLGGNGKGLTKIVMQAENNGKK